ncbi:rod shape-determining protein RodA [soil metagenome]|jgi:rod shape determining protein RodA|nr:rod shape-determining protein RodA [Euzebyaceae bacterium]
MAQIVVDDRSERLAREAVQRKWIGAYTPVRHIDPLLVLAALVLSGFGLLMIYSATFHRLETAGQDPTFYVDRQLVSLGVGLVGMLAVTLFDYRVYRAWAPVLYAVTLGMLGYLLVGGTVINGARAWIVVGGQQFQPSELAKVALILMLAALYHERREEALGLRALVEALVFATLPMVLILLQPDFGTFIVYVAIVFGVLLMARVRVRYMVALAVIGVVTCLAALQFEIVKDYQVDRLTAFFNPDQADALGAAYNVNQAQIAVGSGQFLGQGLFEGSQTSLSFVPENQTDFIFTVVGEELGFLGSGLMLAVFGLLIWRGLRIAALSRDTFGTLIAAGVVSVFAFQLFINVGMAIGLMPVTGLPLPFVSYGGTSLIASFLMVGLLENVHMRRFS